ncbi:MAG: hypothetical protein ACPG31_06770 [Planctomycetota bacterium]
MFSSEARWILLLIGLGLAYLGLVITWMEGGVLEQHGFPFPFAVMDHGDTSVPDPNPPLQWLPYAWLRILGNSILLGSVPACVYTFWKRSTRKRKETSGKD